MSQSLFDHGSREFAPGATVFVRNAEWRVMQVNHTSTGDTALHVLGLSELVRDQEALFLADYEAQFGEPIRRLDPSLTRFVPDTSSHHQASLLYIESLLRRKAPTQPQLSLGHLGAMDLVPYQLEPAWKALQQTRQRILIADAVGLGKTLEAGILLSELVRRGRARRILVLTVKSMLTQFQKELWSRFTLPLVRLDSVGLQRIRTQIPTHHNPFYYVDKAIISIDTLKQNNEYRVYLEKAWWDVIVIDEAHNVATRGGGASQRARLAKLVAGRSDALILLSATPHDGRARSFASLMNMLDPTAIANPEQYTAADIHGLYIRRFKKHILHQVKKAFPEREIARAWASASLPEERAFDTLTTLKLPMLDTQRSGGMLFRTTLEKALFSSPAACLKSIETRISSAQSLTDPSRYALDEHALQGLAHVLRAITPEHFSKYQKLLMLLRDPHKGLGWTGKDASDRLVIFTERIETLDFLETQLSKDLGLTTGEHGQLRRLHGSMSDIDQQKVVEAFGKDRSPVRLLIASDVASEGINLHYLSHRMIHFDIPWSLMVFQQRNGRIDRYGQEQTPKILYLSTQSQNERIHGDTRILEILINKDQQATQDIGDPSALMGVYNIEDEERITARAMEAQVTPEQLDQALSRNVSGNVNVMDLLEALFGGLEVLPPTDAPAGPAPTRDNSPREADALTREGPHPALELTLSGGKTPDTGEAAFLHRQPLPSLFPDDFTFLERVIDFLRPQQGIQARVDRSRQQIELTLNAELQHRFKSLPEEVLPDDHVLVLSADAEALQKEIATARREENTWPKLQYLWPLHPVMDWAIDKMMSNFNQLSGVGAGQSESGHARRGPTAPILQLDPGEEAGPEPGEVIFLISALIPNRKGHPLLHEWFGTRFLHGTFDTLYSFEQLRQRLRLSHKQPNRGVEASPESVEPLLHEAIRQVGIRMKAEHQDYVTRLAPRLAEETARLKKLEQQRLEHEAHHFQDLVQNETTQRLRAEAEAGVRQTFSDWSAWVRDTLTAEQNPFIQVIACFVVRDHAIRR